MRLGDACAIAVWTRPRKCVPRFVQPLGTVVNRCPGAEQMSKVIAVRLLALSCLVLVRTGPTPGDADETACSGGGSGTFVVQELIDPLPDDCDRLVAPNSGVAAAVLRPLNMSSSRDLNFTLVVCVKNVKGQHASLHVVPAAEYHRFARSLNPVALRPGATAIVWSDVPVGTHVAFVELFQVPSPLGEGAEGMQAETRRSRPCIFSRESPAATANELGRGAVLDGHRLRDSDEEDSWPIFQHLRQRNYCGESGWQPVSVHRVIADWLQGEWYKVYTFTLCRLSDTFDTLLVHVCHGSLLDPISLPMALGRRNTATGEMSSRCKASS